MPPPPCQEVPDDRAEKSGHDDVLIDDGQGWIMPLPMVLATAVPRKNAARKLNVAAHTDCQASGREHAGGDDGRDAIRGIVKAVDEVEDQRDEDRDQDEDDVFIQREGLQGAGAEAPIIWIVLNAALKGRSST
jgi:hypothetical protein